jgi:ankyrin repeat protein
VEQGADVNQCEPTKDTPPLIIAVNNGMVDNAKYLIEAGADTSKRNATGKTAYEFAKDSKYQPMIEMFEEMGVTE